MACLGNCFSMENLRLPMQSSRIFLEISKDCKSGGVSGGDCRSDADLPASRVYPVALVACPTVLDYPAGLYGS